jgi:hypothetical protein
MRYILKIKNFETGVTGRKTGNAGKTIVQFKKKIVLLRH